MFLGVPRESWNRDAAHETCQLRKGGSAGALYLMRHQGITCGVGGRTQVNKRSTYARPGMHMQQCPAVPIIVLSFPDRYVHVLSHMLCHGCRVLSTTKGSLHSTTGAASVFRLTLHYGWHAIGHKSVGNHLRRWGAGAGG